MPLDVRRRLPWPPVRVLFLSLVVLAVGAASTAAGESARSRLTVDVVGYALADHYASSVVVDAAESTVYVANNGTNDVTLLDRRTCSAATTRGCRAVPPRQDVGVDPTALALNARTHTVYVANYGDTGAGTVSVLDTRRCSITHRR